MTGDYTKDDYVKCLSCLTLRPKSEIQGDVCRDVNWCVETSRENDKNKR